MPYISWYRIGEGTINSPDANIQLIYSTTGKAEIKIQEPQNSSQRKLSHLWDDLLTQPFLVFIHIIYSSDQSLIHKRLN